MPFVKLSLNIEDKEYSADGKDQLEFYIVTNKGESPKPLAKIASGGELSRVMLALKSIVAKYTSLPTMIFDEIDTGVSGRAAQKIGEAVGMKGGNVAAKGGQQGLPVGRKLPVAGKNTDLAHGGPPFL